MRFTFELKSTVNVDASDPEDAWDKVEEFRKFHLPPDDLFHTHETILLT